MNHEKTTFTVRNRHGKTVGREKLIELLGNVTTAHPHIVVEKTLWPNDDLGKYTLKGIVPTDIEFTVTGKKITACVSSSSLVTQQTTSDAIERYILGGL